MKKVILLLGLVGWMAVGLSKPVVTNVKFPKEADVFGLFELSFNLGEYANPYDPEVIDVYAVFKGPDNHVFKVIGFYCEGYTFSQKDKFEQHAPTREKGWKVRFTPDAVGEWTFSLHAVDSGGETVLNAYQSQPFSFRCNRVDKAEGFITKANARFLKREAFVNGRRQIQPFFPVGPNIAWYESPDHKTYKQHYGIYEYERMIDTLSGISNYMRIWINRYQFLAIYGPEHTETVNGRPVMYFDSKLNQKDSAELDYIVQYAHEHGVSIMACIFNFRNFMHKSGVGTGTPEKPAMPSDWYNNPYHTVLGLQSQFEFFTDARAIRISKNLIRYIVARWGYATNIACWELWNELANMANGQAIPIQTQHEIVQWHDLMADYIRSIDPYHHLISTSLGSGQNIATLSNAFNYLDMSQDHNYQNIQKAKSKEQFSKVLYDVSATYLQAFPDKPFFVGEFGFGQEKPTSSYQINDPWGIDIHNSLWSSLFSGSAGPASFWYWNVLQKIHRFYRFKPVYVFSKNLTLLSGTFTPDITGVVVGNDLVFPNNLATYYLMNASEDTLMGWSQDTAFCYQSLRRLTNNVGKDGHFTTDAPFDPKGYVFTLNPVKRPAPSSPRNTITFPITKQPVGTRYEVRWYNTETGLEIPSERTTATVRRSWIFWRRLYIEFPSSIRDVDRRVVNNTFGDAAFIITKAK